MKKGVSLFAFNKDSIQDENNYLFFQPGENITIVEENNNWGWGQIDQNFGMVPLLYLNFPKPEQMEKPKEGIVLDRKSKENTLEKKIGSGIIERKSSNPLYNESASEAIKLERELSMYVKLCQELLSSIQNKKQLISQTENHLKDIKIQVSEILKTKETYLNISEKEIPKISENRLYLNKILNEEDNEEINHKSQNQMNRTSKIIKKHQKGDVFEISVNKGDQITIILNHHSGWSIVRKDNAVGWIPNTCLPKSETELKIENKKELYEELQKMIQITSSRASTTSTFTSSTSRSSEITFANEDNTLDSGDDSHDSHDTNKEENGMVIPEKNTKELIWPKYLPVLPGEVPKNDPVAYKLYMKLLYLHKTQKKTTPGNSSPKTKSSNETSPRKQIPSQDTISSGNSSPVNPSSPKKEEVLDEKALKQKQLENALMSWLGEKDPKNAKNKKPLFDSNNGNNKKGIQSKGKSSTPQKIDLSIVSNPGVRRSSQPHNPGQINSPSNKSSAPKTPLSRKSEGVSFQQLITTPKENRVSVSPNELVGEVSVNTHSRVSGNSVSQPHLEIPQNKLDDLVSLTENSLSLENLEIKENSLSGESEKVILLKRNTVSELDDEEEEEDEEDSSSNSTRYVDTRTEKQKMKDKYATTRHKNRSQSNVKSHLFKSENLEILDIPASNYTNVEFGTKKLIRSVSIRKNYRITKDTVISEEIFKKSNPLYMSKELLLNPGVSPVSMNSSSGNLLNLENTSNGINNNNSTNNISSNNENQMQTPTTPNSKDNVVKLSVVEFAVKLMNKNSPKKGLEFLVKEGIVPDDPLAIAKFLYSHSVEKNDITKETLGELFGLEKQYYIDIFNSFISLLKFSDLDPDVSLRRMLFSFKLPGEAQKIDRIMKGWARCYFESIKSKGFFKSELTLHILSFSLLMLNTDAHTDDVVDKMTVKQFITNLNLTLSKDENLPIDYLEDVYHRIVNEEIRMKDEAPFPFAIKKGYAELQSLQNKYVNIGTKVWRKKWCVLMDDHLYICKSPHDKVQQFKLNLNNVFIIKKSKENDVKRPHKLVLVSQSSHENVTENYQIVFAFPSAIALSDWTLQLSKFGFGNKNI
eukprot:TRINITY_DN1337_c1_g1_i1.p1 TRINITY_DN1337_c1_g1~~TRINITY_DN1337_c1_g1_i1.p1  ORF type:complete len:1095 (-),score=396.89 TRINITY_DN1337_c1_g1_i1:70-3354(-)